MARDFLTASFPVSFEKTPFFLLLVFHLQRGLIRKAFAWVNHVRFQKFKTQSEIVTIIWETGNKTFTNQHTNSLFIFCFSIFVVTFLCLYFHSFILFDHGNAAGKRLLLFPSCQILVLVCLILTMLMVLCDHDLPLLSPIPYQIVLPWREGVLCI